MRRALLSLVVLFAGSTQLVGESIPKFKTQEIATDLTVGYAVIAADINGDKKPDIVVVDSKRVVWYENPTWKPRVIIGQKTRPDNVCIAAHDIDGDGQLDLVLGADWKPFNTKEGGTLQWLSRGKSLDDEWTVHAIGDEPTVHRVRMADIDGDGKAEIILAPLMGRDSSAKGNWLDGRPVRILAYPIPADPIKGPWKPITLSDSLNVVHNIWPLESIKKPQSILAASYEGVSILEPGDVAGKYKTTRIGEGNQANPKTNRGASEIKEGTLQGKVPYIATIEPWHGNQVVVYTPPASKDQLWERLVLDDHLRWGHGVWCADLDNDGNQELIIGVRDNPAKTDTFNERCGVRVYRANDPRGKKWERTILDDGGVAVEDLTAADLNGDGRIDIVAVGRATKNARIYWNQGK